MSLQQELDLFVSTPDSFKAPERMHGRSVVCNSLGLEGLGRGSCVSYKATTIALI